jgi:hypothetical protein
MGRQIQLSMLPEDVDALLTYIKSRHSVVVVKRDDADSAIVKPLELLPRTGVGTLILWNQELLPELKRKLISGATHGNYFHVDEQAQPVLEFGASILGRWRDRPSLTQGRIYGVFDNKSKAFSRWFDQITRHIRKAFVRNPANLSGYVGPVAYKWFCQGGLLLPTFLPPDTPAWQKFFGEEDLIRDRLNATTSTHQTEN